jgi:hypothetical protein
LESWIQFNFNFRNDIIPYLSARRTEFCPACFGLGQKCRWQVFVAANKGNGERRTDRIFVFSFVESTWPWAIARGRTGFPAEALRERAGVGAAHFQHDSHHSPLLLAEQPTRPFHPQADELARRSSARRANEQAIEVGLAEAGLCRQPFQAELPGEDVAAV